MFATESAVEARYNVTSFVVRPVTTTSTHAGRERVKVKT